jgi:hypothetical protein
MLFHSQRLILAAVLLLQRSCCVAGQRGGRGQLRSSENHRDLGVGERTRDEFVSFFEVTYDIRDGIDLDDLSISQVLENAANALVPAYNDLIQDFKDPFDRRMRSIRILTADIEYDDEPSRRHGRRLDIFTAILEAAGDCTGCPKDSEYSNQVTTGDKPRLLLDFRGAKKPKMVDEQPYFDSMDDTEFPGSGPSEETEGSETSTDEPSNENPVDGSTGDFLPTEDEILAAYSQFVQELGDPYVSDVLSLDEIELDFSRPAMSSKKSKKSKSKGGGNKGEGGDKGNGGDKKRKKIKKGKKEDSKNSKKTTVDDKGGSKAKEGKRRRI